MKILFKYPTCKRPEWFKSTLRTYKELLSEEHDYHFIITMNDEDETMNNNKMRSFLDEMKVEYHYNKDIKTKIEACNANLEGRIFDILFLISDDMIPIVPGFDLIIAEQMKKYFPDMDGALHFYDGREISKKLITLSIMGKKLYDSFGYVYNSSYKSFFCDEEFTEEVYRMKKVVYFSQVIVKHDWSGGPNSDDILYRQNSKLGKEDKQIFNRRKLLDFPKNSWSAI